MLHSEGNTVAVVREFLSAEEHAVLLGWAEHEYQLGSLRPNPRGPSRFYATHDRLSRIPDEFWTARARALALFRVTKYEEDPVYKCFLGCNLEGAFVHQHRDPAPPGKVLLRFNVMLSRPDDGGMPIIGKTQLAIGEGDLWSFFPSYMLHETTPVAGQKKRLVLSIGVVVDSPIDAERQRLLERAWEEDPPAIHAITVERPRDGEARSGCPE